MKFRYDEGQWGLMLTLVPEDPAECAELLRFSANAKAEKATVYFTFHNDEPKLEIQMAKVKSNIVSSIRPGKK